MTLRAVLLGLFAAFAVCSITYFNDAVIRQTFFVGNHLPVGVFGALIAWVALINPLLGRAGSGWSLAPRELAVALCITLCACAIPGSGLMRFFPNMLVLPIHLNSLQPDWRQYNVLSYVPPQLLVAGGHDDERAVGGFVLGLGKGDRPIGFGEVPFDAWLRPLSYWVPILLLIYTALIGLAFVVHPQWAEREHLAFPTAEIAATLLCRKPSRSWPDCFYDRLFWGGFCAVAALHLLNGSQRWIEQLPPFPTYLNLWAFRDVMGELGKAFGSDQFFLGMVIPTVVAFAYFVPTDVSFTLGIGAISTMLISLFLTRSGLDVVSDVGGSSTISNAQFGAYLAACAMIVYTGRAHYRATFAAALGLAQRWQTEGPEVSAVWGARVWLCANALLVVLFVRLGVDWTIAVPFVLLFSLVMLVLARILAETGLFFLQCMWNPCSITISLFGLPALGPKLVATLASLTAPIAIDLRESFLPFAVNGLQVGHRQGQKMGLVGLLLPFSMAGALLIALGVTLWIQYDQGYNRNDGYGAGWMPTYPYTSAVQTVQRLQADLEHPQALEQSLARTPLGRLMAARPTRGTLPSVLTGFTLVLLFSFLRLRFAWWPVHPVLFLVAFTYPMLCFWACFFLGWLIKTAVVTFGGGRIYHRLKPLMVGFVAGEVSALFVYFLFAVAYYAATGIIPKQYYVFPG